MSRIFLINNIETQIDYTQIIPLNHHLWPSTSVWQCLHLQRPFPLPLWIFLFCRALGVSLRVVVCNPQPITACREWGAGLYKNVANSCQIVTTWDHQKRVRAFEPRRRKGGGANFGCCVYKQQPTNPTLPLTKTPVILSILVRCWEDKK